MSSYMLFFVLTSYDQSRIIGFAEFDSAGFTMVHEYVYVQKCNLRHKPSIQSQRQKLESLFMMTDIEFEECFIFRKLYNFFRTVLKIKSPSWTSSRRKCKWWSLGKTMPWIKPTLEKGRQRKRNSRFLEKIAELTKKLAQVKDNMEAKASSWASQQKTRRSREISYQSNVNVSFFWMYVEDVLGGNRQLLEYLLYFKKKRWNLLIN